jgi:hypothetical protein
MLNKFSIPAIPPPLPSSLKIQQTKNEALEMFHVSKKLIDNNEGLNDSLTTGNLGLVIFYYNVYNALGNKSDADRAKYLLQIIFNRIDNTETLLFKGSFANGICGFNACLNYLSKHQFIELDLKTECEELDSFLFENAIIMVENGQNDYFYGSLGILNYFISRLPDPLFIERTKLIFIKIYESILSDKIGSWLENSILGNEEIDEVNFSLSHGQCAFLMILLKMYESNIERTKVTELIVSGIAYMMDTLEPVDFSQNKYAYFPNSQHKTTKIKKFSNRLAWCYGDLNQTLVLYKAAELLKNNDYQYIADIIGTSATLRISKENTLCCDSHFCHGSSGLAEFFNALYKIRPIDAYASSQYFWVKETLANLNNELNNGFYINKETKLLDGLVGPSLTLLSFSLNKKMDWSSFFMLE